MENVKLGNQKLLIYVKNLTIRILCGLVILYFILMTYIIKSQSYHNLYKITGCLVIMLNKILHFGDVVWLHQYFLFPNQTTVCLLNQI